MTSVPPPQVARRSTLDARAPKENQTADFYRDLFNGLYARQQDTHAVFGKRFRFKGNLFSRDVGLIDLSTMVFPWTDVAPQKAAFKLNLDLDHDGFIPAITNVSKALVSEMIVGDTFAFPNSNVLVFDRGYCRCTWHRQLTDKGLFWVTRA